MLQSLPASTSGGTTVPYSRVYVRAAGDYLAIGLGAWQTSDAMVVAATAAVNAANVAEADGGSPSADALVGGTLNLAMVEYFQQCNAGEQALAGLTGGIPLYNVVSSAVATAYSGTTTQNSNVQFRYLPGSMGIDAQANNYLAFSNDETSVLLPLADSVTFATTEDEDRYDLIGCNDSSLEGLVLEDLTNMPTMSTVQSLQSAGSATATIDSANLAATETQTWWTTIAAGSDAAILSGIVGWVGQGDTVTVPEEVQTVGSGGTAWTGVGYTVTLTDNLVQYYVLSGGMGGTVQTEFGANTGGPSDAVVISPPSASQSNVGEPINPANGDVTHTRPTSASRTWACRWKWSANTTPTTRPPRGRGRTGAWATAGRSATATR